MSDMHRITTDATITTEMVNDLEMALMVARKDGEIVQFVVPYGPDHTAALKFGQDLVDRLRRRGLTITVQTARADNGLALLLEEVAPDPEAA